MCLERPRSVEELVEATKYSLRTVYRAIGELRKDPEYEVLRLGSKGDVLYTVKKRED